MWADRFVERPGRGDVEEPTSHLEHARAQVGLGRFDRPASSVRRVSRRRDCTLQERSSGGLTASRLGSVGRESSSCATASLGPTVAAARCHPRRSGSTSRSVTWANARWAARRSDPPADRYTVERASGWRNLTRSPTDSSPSVASIAGVNPETITGVAQEQRIANRLGRSDDQERLACAGSVISRLA